MTEPLFYSMAFGMTAVVGGVAGHHVYVQLVALAMQLVAFRVHRMIYD